MKISKYSQRIYQWNYLRNPDEIIDENLKVFSMKFQWKSPSILKESLIENPIENLTENLQVFSMKISTCSQWKFQWKSLSILLGRGKAWA